MDVNDTVQKRYNDSTAICSNFDKRTEYVISQKRTTLLNIHTVLYLSYYHPSYFQQNQ